MRTNFSKCPDTRVFPMHDVSLPRRRKISDKVDTWIHWILFLSAIGDIFIIVTILFQYVTNSPHPLRFLLTREH